MKTHSGAKKRFAVTATGKVTSRAAHRRHRMTSKSKKGKMDRRATMILFEGDARAILDDFLPYEAKKRRKRNKPKYISKNKREAA
jgi:large subunit ribosomal protein L35